MNDELVQLCKNLRLKRIAKILDRELRRAGKREPSYEEFLTRLFREEYQDKRDRSVAYQIKQAKLPEEWVIDTFPFKKQPGVSATIIRQLAELDFVPRGESIVFIGDTGVGKTGLGSGLLLKAIDNGYRGRFIKAQDLFEEMWASLADRSTRSFLNRLMTIDVLLIDELGYLNIRPEQANIFFRLMEERYVRHKATIVTTNLDYSEWHEFLGNKRMVDALVDRLLHRCHTIRIEGPSLRDRKN